MQSSTPSSLFLLVHCRLSTQADDVTTWHYSEGLVCESEWNQLNNTLKWNHVPLMVMCDYNRGSCLLEVLFMRCVNPRATRHTSTQSNICSSVAMSSSRSLSSCWLSSAGDRIFFDWTASRPEPSDRMSCSFCLDWGNDEKRWGRDDEMKRKEAGFTDICWFDQKASLPTCCEINAWMSSPSGRKSIQLRPDSLHKEPTVLWLCGDQMKFRHKITPLLFEMTCSICLDSKKTEKIYTNIIS